MLVGGNFSTLGGQLHQCLGRLNGDGTLDSSFNPGANSTVRCLAIQTDGRIVVGGSFSLLGGQLHQCLGRLDVDGKTESTFIPEANGPVLSLAIQADGRIVVGGEFTTLAGRPRSYLGRLNNIEPAIQWLISDGMKVEWLRGGSSPEVSRVAFDYSTNNGISWTALGNGTRISGGWQLTNLSAALNGTIRARGNVVGGGQSDWFVAQIIGSPVIVFQPTSIAKDLGSTASFSVTAAGSTPFQYQWFKDGVALTNGTNVTGAMNAVLTINKLMATDGGDYVVVVSNRYGSVTSAVTTIQLNLCTPDTGFNPVANDLVTSLAIQADGKIIVGGNFTTLGGQKRQRIGRLNTDGTIDSIFNPGANSFVTCLAIQTDEKIVVGGSFTSLGGQVRAFIGRLNRDGTVDSGFNPEAGGEVRCLAMQADGKMVLAGTFGSLGGQYHPSIGRLNVDGSADNTFRPSARGSTIYCLAIQADGKVIVGGSMNSLSDLPCKNIGRLNDAEPATQQLSYDGSTVTWLRGGTGPDVWRSTFEFATNGLDWTLIGNGARVSGGWQLTNVSIPSSAMIRARGSAITGGVSDWFVETTIGSTAPAMSLSIDRLGAGPVLRVTGGIGLQYLLEYTPGLSATNVWQSMPFTLTNNPQIIIDETMTNANQRYYRLRTN